MDTPHKPLRQPGLIVYLCGLGTSALALWGVNVMNDHGENIMGWYANGIIPAGALIVGLASGTGYALGSRFLNVKLSKAFVAGMITTGLLDYVAAQYLTYTHILEQQNLDPEQYSFVKYIQFISENMVFKSSSSSGGEGSPLGGFGYVYKVLEMIGYSIGCMLPSLAVFGMPYCKGCQSYLKPYRSSYINSPELWPDVKKLPRKERLAALQGAIQSLTQRAQEVVDRIVHAPLAETVSEVEAFDPKLNKNSAARIQFVLKKCPQCDAHHVQLNLFNMAVNKKPVTTKLNALDKTQLVQEGAPV